MTSSKISPYDLSLCLYLAYLTTVTLASTQFSSHVSINTPARSFSHGVGNPVAFDSRAQQRKPQIAFGSLLQHSIPILPLSPYKVDSSDPESLWPEGLFLPPLSPPRFQLIATYGRRSDTGRELFDPYLLEGTEAIAAIKRADTHGHLFFHEIPHIESLLANQEIRVKNNLKPHRIASIRHTWPYNRP